eukprot:Skav226104  [mRNA]  locus=scaffold702:11923:14481:+ [translate_table: standard]
MAKWRSGWLSRRDHEPSVVFTEDATPQLCCISEQWASTLRWSSACAMKTSSGGTHHAGNPARAAPCRSWRVSMGEKR